MRAEQSEFAVADDSDAIVPKDPDAFENPASRCQWFGEDCMLVRNVVGNS